MMKNRWDNVTQEELDEMVHDAKSGEAASINNRGRDAQIDFLDDFPHLSGEQKEVIHNEILRSDLKDVNINYLQVLGPFQHLTGAQALAINQEAIGCRVEACLESGGAEGGYLWNTVRDLVGKEDVQTQLESISSDPEIVKHILGFDPWCGEDAEAEQIRDEKRGLYPEHADPCN